jgi:hypothetical protein
MDDTRLPCGWVIDGKKALLFEKRSENFCLIGVRFGGNAHAL